ncbi:putative membrane protein [Escherichia coli 3006]|nr:putative membrane protein [Escherichia coli 3006]
MLILRHVINTKLQRIIQSIIIIICCIYYANIPCWSSFR